MASRKYYERLLVVAGMFLIFFVITVISLPLIMHAIGLEHQTRESLLLMSALQALILFVAPSLVSARIISDSPIKFLSLRVTPTFLSLLGVVFAYLIALPALNQIIYWNSNLSFPDGLATWGEMLKEMEENANAASSIMLDTTSLGGMIANLAVVALITAFGEELFFRGTLQNAAASNGSNHTAIWVVALLFSAMHFQIFGFVPRLLLGAWFGYLLYWTRSIYVPVAAHFINNGVVVVCAWLSARGSQIEFDKFGVTETGFPMPAFISALATVVFIIYFKDFFFKSGKEKEISAEYA